MTHKGTYVKARYLLTRLLFWRRCWWCRYSGFGTWPSAAEPIAYCHRLGVYVAHNEFCSSWEGIPDDDAETRN